MKLDLSPLEILVFPTAFQGLLLSFITWFRGKHRSHIFLAVFLFFISFQLLPNSDICLNFALEYPVVIPFFDCIPFILSPSIFLYIHLNFYGDYLNNRTYLYHFIPAVLNLLFLLLLFTIDGRDSFLLDMTHTVNGSPPLYMSILFLLRVLSAIVYIFLIIRVFIAFRIEMKKWQNKQKMWFYSLIFTFALTWIAISIMSLIINTSEPDPSLIFIQSLTHLLCFTLFIYMITGFALAYPNILEPKHTREKVRNQLNLSNKKIEKIQKDLTRLLEEEEVFLDSDLSLNKLAGELNIHPNILSFVINDRYGINFLGLMNRYKVEKFITLAETMNPKIDTVLSLAFNAGFTSKSTFNRIFKDIKKVTPSQYIRSIKEK